MQYALVNNKKIESNKGLKGICLSCGREVQAKCGQIKVHHWAHKSIKDCDSWSEPETEWHREWKNKFPAEYREISFTDKNTGEIHRADIHTSKGVTVEFQNSPISIEELESREHFYSDLIWIVNAKKFNIQFTNIPNPYHPILKDYSIVGTKHILFFKNEGFASLTNDVDRIFHLMDKELQGVELSISHYAFEWKNKHQAWLNTKAITYFDFGHDILYRLSERPQERSRFWYFELISKQKLLTQILST